MLVTPEARQASYDAIADILNGQLWVEAGTKRSEVRGACMEVIDEIAEKLVVHFMNTDPDFSTDRFMAAIYAGGDR